ncbi:MAG: ATP-binding cassette domain-containing protein [Bacilli bacterium]|nr:ATP-binding cassette domain-containing protein [Bacilli bacterium]MDD3304817.1 ATP-binding cassette domain-containing protein [Bacilli bacterium]MDD4053404.1 ATP-binding cassette domain-containing protein [Bacilli bacterium]MDD4410949.1 ATP-binding cassette domain-containing protein [Bacilli bacterium]
MNNIIGINSLSFRYQSKFIFEKFTLNIKDGEWISIVGPNGSGKSTLVKILIGLLESDSNIIVDKLTLNRENIDKIRKKIGVVFENTEDSFVAETVADDIAFTLENLAYDPKEIGRMVEDIAMEFKIDDILEKEPNFLSGGEKQKVALASAMVARPKILIIDDALEMIDEKSKNEILEILNKLHKERYLTIITITQNLEETYKTDRMVVINDGNILIDGPTINVLEEDKIFNRIGLSLPFMVDLSIKLKLYGLIDHIILDMDEMVNALWK